MAKHKFLFQAWEESKTKSILTSQSLLWMVKTKALADFTDTLYHCHHKSSFYCLEYGSATLPLQEFVPTHLTCLINCKVVLGVIPFCLVHDIVFSDKDKRQKQIYKKWTVWAITENSIYHPYFFLLIWDDSQVFQKLLFMKIG
jgi:hypothetical protein